MSRRAALIGFAMAAVVVLAALVWAGATDRRPTAFPIDVPNNAPVASLQPGQRLCQGPIVVMARFSAVEMWVRPARALKVEVTSARAPGRTLAERPAHLTPRRDGREVIGFQRPPASRGERVELCVINAGPHPITFEGGPPSRQSGRLRVAGRASNNDIALLFLRSHGPTLLSLLPTVFHRAALFKLEGVGAWTFWVLLAGVLAAFPLTAFALASAVKADGAADDEGGG